MEYVYEFRSTPRPRLTRAAESPVLPLRLAADDVVRVAFPDVTIPASLTVPGLGRVSGSVPAPLTYEVRLDAAIETRCLVRALRSCGPEFVRVERVLRDVLSARLGEEGLDLTPAPWREAIPDGGVTGAVPLSV